jgi:hypothetical protein
MKILEGLRVSSVVLVRLCRVVWETQVDGGGIGWEGLWGKCFMKHMLE